MTYTLFVGLEKDKDGKQITAKDAGQLAKLAEDETARVFGGYSAIPVYGGWVDPSGAVIKELSLRFEVIGSDVEPEKVTAWAGVIRDIYRQQAVLLVETGSTTTFV